MPHSIFFTDAGHAIHGSHATNYLGSPASHGCVRLAPKHASILFDLVMVEGPENTRLKITGMDPIGTGVAGGNGSGTNLGVTIAPDHERFDARTGKRVQ